MHKGIQAAIRKENYKLILYHVKGKETIQLLDLEKDPRALDDLSTSKSSIAKKLLDELNAWDEEKGLASRK